MDKYELINFLKENLRIEMTTDEKRSCDGCSQVLKTKILIDDILITEKECDIFYIGPMGEVSI